jgi:hypothetical protein
VLSILSAMLSQCSPIPHPAALGTRACLPGYTNRRRCPDRLPCDADRREPTKEHGGKDPYSMIVFTNHPHHYAAKDEKDPKKHVYSIVSDDTYVPNVEALLSLHQAVTLYGNIPNEFPESEAVRGSTR